MTTALSLFFIAGGVFGFLCASDLVDEHGGVVVKKEIAWATELKLMTLLGVGIAFTIIGVVMLLWQFRSFLQQASTSGL